MPRPQMDTRSRSQLDDSRRPEHEDHFDKDLGHSLVRRPFDKVARAKADTVTMQRRKALTQRALSLFASGATVIEIAELFQTTPQTITGWVARHKRDLEEGEIDSRLERIAVPLATDNLIQGLLAGDKDYTLKTLEGRGKLRRHTQGEEKVQHDIPELVIRFVPVQSDSEQANPGPKHITGQVLGTPVLPRALPAHTPEAPAHVVGRPIEVIDVE